ncbi:MAG: branched-chain amino acid aminotransferase [Muribaculaceae bacterium]|nr:branched-chain amino acid aminotransferase [Muribaculaceae bacterium]
MEMEIDWSNLGFGYYPTDYNVRCEFKDGKWGPVTVTDDVTINIHMAATCLHYGQEAFEGLKAFRGEDGKIRIFRMDENAKRFISSAEGIKMQPLPEELFKEMVVKLIKANERFVPPYGSGAALYIRPLEIGISPQVGVRPAREYMVVMFCCPVGPYFKSGFRPGRMCIMREYDRVAPKGTGRFKIGANYATSLYAGELALSKGYNAVLYLDPKDKKYLDECGPANFFAIKDGKYITPASDSILPSITNKSLQQLAEDLGLVVEKRRIAVEELTTVDEAAACGTAAVATPIAEIDDLDNNTTYVIAKDGKPGKYTTLLYNTLQDIQMGRRPDIHGWTTIVE